MEQDAAIEVATELLWSLTARQFGVCTATIEPILECLWTTELDTGLWPVTEITEIREDSVVLDPASYYVDHYRKIIRSEGRFSSTTDRIEIDLVYGQPPPALLKRATAVSACEFLKHWNGKPCHLPDRVTSVSRPGVSMDIKSVDDLVQNPNGPLTGIYEVDLAIRLYNPNGLQSGSMVWSPEIHKRHRVRTS